MKSQQTARESEYIDIIDKMTVTDFHCDINVLDLVH